MARRSKHKEGARSKPRVLQGYRQEGKRFIPPFIQHVPVRESSWIDDRVPELIWIALLIRMFGLKEGVSIALSIAKATAKCAPTAMKAFASASDYVELSDEQRRSIRSVLAEEGMLKKVGRGLEALIHNYADCPFAFLSPDGYQNGPLGSTLENVREAIASISDRESQLSTYSQATVAYIFLVNGRLTVAPHVSLANLPAIEDYPSTEESLRVAAAVRSAVTHLISHDGPSKWPNSFWNQGRFLSACEVQ